MQMKLFKATNTLSGTVFTTRSLKKAEGKVGEITAPWGGVEGASLGGAQRKQIAPRAPRFDHKPERLVKIEEGNRESWHQTLEKEKKKKEKRTCDSKAETYHPKQGKFKPPSPQRLKGHFLKLKCVGNMEAIYSIVINKENTNTAKYSTCVGVCIVTGG